ncbi:MAG: dihydrodipicolinate synthase family protein [Cellulomonadaceae bacterium]
MSVPTHQVFSAVPVLFTADEELDEPATAALLADLANAGVDAAFVGGTTGEFTALSDEERVRIFALAVEVFGAEGTVAHVGATSARQAVRLTRAARELGVARVAAITPYFHPGTPDRVVEYYARVAEAADGGGVFVYTYTELTGADVTPELLGRIAEIPGTIGTKVSAQPIGDLPALAAATPDGFDILWGNDAVFDEVCALGALGTVSGVSSAFPEVFVGWAAAMRAGDAEASARWGAQARDAVRAVSCGIGGLKRALSLRGYGTDTTRIPTAMPDARQHAQIVAELARTGA